MIRRNRPHRRVREQRDTEGGVVEGGTDVAKITSDINQALANAPREIKPDLQTIANVELPILDGRVTQAQIGAELADPGFRSALEPVADWSRSHCGTGG